MKLKELELIAQVYAKDFFGIDCPVIQFATPRELGNLVDGEFSASAYKIYVRRNPIRGNMRSLIAHELAHAWQFRNNLPLDEMQAEEMAFACCGSDY
jgi:uncharacterized protein YjaZ